MLIMNRHADFLKTNVYHNKVFSTFVNSHISNFPWVWLVNEFTLSEPSSSRYLSLRVVTLKILSSLNENQKKSIQKMNY